ncbi:MAG: hypothetical protein F6K19_34415 [Cyanothece sp. SIO1E1]|nr:hypothetical protein [Cyanothece sp. SIO1E1]
MVIVFYRYGVRVDGDNASSSQSLAPMFFPVPPQVGQMVKLHSTGMPALIRQIDHYRMVIDITPISTVEVMGEEESGSVPFPQTWGKG